MFPILSDGITSHPLLPSLMGLDTLGISPIFYSNLLFPILPFFIFVSPVLDFFRITEVAKIVLMVCCALILL